MACASFVRFNVRKTTSARMQTHLSSTMSSRYLIKWGHSRELYPILKFILFHSLAGPCPPCPQTVTVTCYCAKSPAQVRRCSSQAFSCGKRCSKLLPCQQHKCEVVCHTGPCPPCPKKSSQKCLCGAKKEERPCHSIEFQCDKVCLWYAPRKKFPSSIQGVYRRLGVWKTLGLWTP